MYFNTHSSGIVRKLSNKVKTNGKTTEAKNLFIFNFILLLEPFEAKPLIFALDLKGADAPHHQIPRWKNPEQLYIH